MSVQLVYVHEYATGIYENGWYGAFLQAQAGECGCEKCGICLTKAEFRFIIMTEYLQEYVHEHRACSFLVFAVAGSRQDEIPIRESISDGNAFVEMGLIRTESDNWETSSCAARAVHDYITTMFWFIRIELHRIEVRNSSNNRNETLHVYIPCMSLHISSGFSSNEVY